MGELTLTAKLDLQPDGRAETQWRLSSAARSSLVRQLPGKTLVRNYDPNQPIGRVELADEPPKQAEHLDSPGTIWVRFTVTDDEVGQMLAFGGLGTEWGLGPTFKIEEQETLELDAGENGKETVSLVTALDLLSVTLFQRNPPV